MQRLMRALLLVLLLVPLSAAQGGSDAWPSEEPLRVGVSTNTAPAAFQLPDGTFGGWGVDMMALASIKTGIEVEFVPYPSLDAGVAMLENGTLDAVGVMSTRPDLTAFASMPTPWSWTPVSLITNRAHDWLEPSEATGRISTIHGSPLQGIVEGRFAHMEYVVTDNPGAGMEALAAGELDAYVAPLAIAGYNIQRLQLDGLRPVGDHLSIVETGFWAADPAAIVAVEALRQAISPDEAKLLYVKWTGFDLSEPREPESRVPTWLLYAGLIFAGALVLAVAFIVLLRIQVRAATHEIEAKNQELQIKALAELENAHKMERFATDLINRTAHELSTPLTPLVLGVQTLRTQLGGEHDDVLERFDRNVQRMQTTIQTAVDASRAQAAEMHARQERVDIPAVLDGIAARYRAQAEAAGLDLQVDAASGEAQVDRGRLLLALGHLVENAIKFAGTGSVRLIHEVVPGGHKITVADEGPGIDLEALERLWRPFAKGEDASLAGRAGQGLGLYITRRLMELEGGTVGCDSAPGAGARFWIELPAPS